MWLYNIAIYIYTMSVRLVSLWHEKARKWVAGRKDLFARLAEQVSATDRVVWIHVSSLGEFEQGRPIIEQIKRRYPKRKILLTFFSPSGYEVRKDYDGADYVFYMPADTRSNASCFLDIVNPEVVIFIKNEFWLNMLSELHRRKVKTYLASALFRRNSVFFRFYGWMWRRSLHSFDTIFVQDESSKELLLQLGVERVVVAGDTRFDRVCAVAERAEKVELVERFKGEKRLFVAGSTWGADEDILLPLINKNTDIKFVVAPHEMDEERIEKLMRGVKGGAVRYTKFSGGDISDKQLFILDTVGLLSRVYGSAEWAYVGGGFGAGIHNTLEAVVYGLPIAFGVKYRKFREACDLVELGIGCSVTNEQELNSWFDELKGDDDYLARLSALAKVYVGQHRGATEKIVDVIFGRDNIL